MKGTLSIGWLGVLIGGAGLLGLLLGWLICKVNGWN
jgi:hypothetical protein